MTLDASDGSGSSGRDEGLDGPRFTLLPNDRRRAGHFVLLSSCQNVVQKLFSKNNFCLFFILSSTVNIAERGVF